MGFCRFFTAIRIRKNYLAIAHVAQLAEHVLGKDEVISSSLIMGSSYGRGQNENDQHQHIAWLKKHFKEPNRM